MLSWLQLLLLKATLQPLLLLLLLMLLLLLSAYQNTGAGAHNLAGLELHVMLLHLLLQLLLLLALWPGHHDGTAGGRLD